VNSRIERPGQTGGTSGGTLPAEDSTQGPPRPDDVSPTRDISVDDAPSVESPRAGASDGFLSASPRRAGLESVFVRVIATAGVVGVGAALGAILVANDVAGWIVGLVVSTVCVLFAAVLWRSRQM
jgi:hypothetical protein